MHYITRVTENCSHYIVILGSFMCVSFVSSKASGPTTSLKSVWLKMYCKVSADSTGLHSLNTTGKHTGNGLEGDNFSGQATQANQSASPELKVSSIDKIQTT